MDVSKSSKKQQNKPSSRKMPKDYLETQYIYFQTAAGKS